MIDLIIFAVAISFWLWVLIVLGLMVWGARAWVRRVCMNDEINKPELRKRRGYHGALNRRHA